jgi:hypothetical protein
MKRALMIAALLIVAGTAGVAATQGRTWNFDRERAGFLAAGFYAPAGAWKVKVEATAPSPPQVLAQLARSSADTFNLALVAGSSYRDVDISVKMRAIAGNVEQGGGIAWRAKDARNYYVARYNPLEGNFRLYKVMNYGRVELASTDIMNVPGWHTIRVVMAGDHILCYYDGTKYLEVRDTTFREAGQVGLWTRGDAQTYFDDLTVVGK